MKYWLIQLVLPWVVLAVPWSVALWQRRWLRAGVLGTAWAAALLCAALLWFGPGMAALGLIGAAAVLTTSVEIRERVVR